jgi:hypothetical protein
VGHLKTKRTNYHASSVPRFEKYRFIFHGASFSASFIAYFSKNSLPAAAFYENGP